ncbi:MAG: bacteriorhodopsin-like [Bacteroidetes bacterium]|jgi:sensory rhodopsin|nr:MAG: rhodopsin [Cryomorphaceae bacterium BACL23 MAG-120924-bin60]MBL6627905.1 bacteriorhodopsin [Cryomorphaceae bacterium]MDA0363642.1 bacteriorhodopsin-like [Bacteroidota bacterium]NCZ94178.1 rhodopsin [Flavobacteriia bacterium]MDA0829344.1 bacteriorhodopsin-like [Bacteroidota bacterium]
MEFLEVLSIDPADPVSFTFFTGYMAMFAASVFFLFERGRVADEWKSSMLVSGLITGIAAVHYYYMRDYYQATHETPVALRYIDWTLTVPLMCVEFYLITKKAGGTSSLLWKLILASVAMLVLGYIGEAFYANETQSWVWGALSGAAYFYIVWMVWKGEVAQLASSAGGNVQKAVDALMKFVVIGWAIYPIGYIAGTEGGLFGMRVLEGLDMDLVYNIGDAVNKIGFGLVIYALAIGDKK